MKDKHLLILIAVLLPLSLFAYMGVLELKAEEPRRAIVAMEMILRGNYIIPQINGWDYFNKPPLFNWVLVLFFKITGCFDEWVVRLPGTLSFLLMGVINFIVVKKYVNKQTAIYSTLFFLTSIDIYFYGIMHAGEIDIFFSLITFVQVLCIFHFYEQKKFLWLFLSSYFLASLGILTKGAPSILFQGITLVAFFLFYKREWKLFFSIRHLLGILLCLSIVSLYFYSYYLQGGELKAYLINLFKEASQKSGLESGISGTLFNSILFPINLIKILLPWSLLLPLFFQKKIKDFITSNRYIMFALIFTLANIPIYWLTDKPANRYIYMFFPFILTIIAYRFTIKSQDIKLHKIVNILTAIAGIFLLTSFIGLYFIPELYFIQQFYAKVSLFMLGAVGIVYLCFKTQLNRVYILVLSIILFRLATATFYLPYEQESSAFSYKRDMKELLEITNQQPILQGGVPYHFTSDASFGSLNLYTDTIKTAPLIAYQFPYYQTLYTNKIMRFEEEMQAGKFYLIYAHQVDTNSTVVIKTFKENWQGDLQLSLVKLK